MTAAASLADRLDAPLYERDFTAWADEQARLLREGRFAQADIVHIVEELEDSGGSARNEVRNRMETILAHLLKLAASPNSVPRSKWRQTIGEARVRVARVLRQNPSLASPAALNEAFPDIEADARDVARIGLDAFGELTPDGARLIDTMRISPDQLLDPSWWPALPDA